MFHPFNAPMARRETTKAKLAFELEDTTLLQAYLSIAHVYIQRATRGGYTKTSVYCPFSIRQEFCQTLTEAGFIVSPHSMVNRFWVSWEKN